MDQREERILIETERFRLTGTVRLPVDGYRSRLTDHLDAGEREFVALTDVDVVPLDGSEPTHRAFVALGRRHIVFATSLTAAEDEPAA
jgi:hypothetical protein